MDEEILEAVRSILEAGKAIGRAEQEAERRRQAAVRVAQCKARKKNKPAEQVTLPNGKNSAKVTLPNGKGNVTLCTDLQCAESFPQGFPQPAESIQSTAERDGVKAVKALIEKAIQQKADGEKEQEKERQRAEWRERQKKCRVAKRGQMSRDMSRDMSHDTLPPCSPPSSPPHTPLLYPPYNPPTKVTGAGFPPKGSPPERERDVLLDSARAREKPVENSAQAERFGRFWREYPRRIQRQAAYRAWLALNPSEELTGIIIESVANQKHSRQWEQDGVRFVPSPTNFIKQRRWEDVAERGEK